ncbi:helix-turn-helix domain-containing protein [Chryseobacterium cucumeris]|uniref:helix-turn-helix domain-containing protein n=1 Tax=Chryseobacterium cucumeris TaxID=1813611 RepID=UPI003209E371
MKNFKELRESLNLSQQELAEKLGVHYRTIQNWEKGSKIPDSKIEFVENFFKNSTHNIVSLTKKNKLGEVIQTTNDDFFSHLPEPEPRITEEDTYKKLEELRKKRNSNPEPSSRVINDDDLVDAIEYKVPWKGQAGMASKFYPEEMIDQLQKTVVKVKPEYRGVFYRIEVDGNSMPPKIQPGDWLRCEEISSLFWLEKNFFKKDKIYCIWHNARGIIFKRLIYKELGEIWCSSDNEDKSEFPDFPLEIEKVNKILVVRALVDRKF